LGTTVSIDTGGTFTDGYFTRAASSCQVKVETTPHDLTEGLARCLAEGASGLGYPGVQALLLETDAFRFSSTIGINSIIQRSGPRVGLLVSPGAHQTLYGPDPSPLYDVFLRPELVVELADPEDAAEVKAAVRHLLIGGVRVLVASLAGSEEDPGGEQAVKKVVYSEYPRHYLGAVPCLLASDVTPRPGAERRTATAVIDAYLYPDMVKVLYKADEDLRRQGYPHPLLVVHSSGGVARVAKTRAIETYGSGPVGGVYGSARLARHYQLPAIVTMDIGGTSTEMSLVIGGNVPADADPAVAGIPVHTPRVRVEAVGGGGGSVIRRSPDGGFRVGPDSVGAVPGPACYARGGTQATVTDAEVVLGHLDPGWFLGGRLRLDPERARAALERLGGGSPEEVAWSAHRGLVAVAAARVTELTASAGVSPAEVALFAFGGAGGLVAAEVVAACGLARALCAVSSAVFSAFGIAGMPLAHTYETGPGPGLADRLATLADRAALDLAGEGFDPASLSLVLGVDHTGGHDIVRVDGPWDEVVARVVAPPGESVRAVRLQAIVPITHAPLTAGPTTGGTTAVGPGGSPETTAACRRERTVYRPGGPAVAAVYDRDSLAPGARLLGPVLVETADTVIVVPEGFGLSVDQYGTVILEAS
jgi:N-methylhydantoinase A/oxoprolinase/acetone carboxylase beta subunit